MKAEGRIKKSLGRHALCALLLCTSSFILHPSSFSQTTEIYATNVDGVTDLRWDRYVPLSGGPTWPAAIVVHGGNFKSGTRNASAAVAQDLRAAGFVAFAIDFRLAPPHSEMNEPIEPGDGQGNPENSDGRPPQQTDDVRAAIRAARADSQCNGKVAGVGGSSGNTPLMWWAAKGTPGDDKPDVIVCLSGPYDLANTTALTDTSFRNSVENYINHTTGEGAPFTAAAQAASPYWLSELDSATAPSLIINSETENMPLVEWSTMVSKLTSVGADFESIERTGATEHSFNYWTLGGTGSVEFPIVRDYAIDFLYRKLGDTAPPVEAPANIIIKRK